MFKQILIIAFILLSAVTVSARTIKVLIIDDMFQNIPQKDEKIERMGKLSGDLLVNGTHYLGNIEIWNGRKGLYLINELPLEDYVKSVVAAEVGINWDMEALKVQAVIARTYALYQMKGTSNRNYDLTSSVLHQVYKGSSIDPRISYAVMHTEGEVLMYNGELIESFYHSTSGGRTENPEEVFGKSYPYMKSVESSGEISPFWIWERIIPLEEIENALSISGINSIVISSYTSTNRVKTVLISHGSGEMTVKATDLRKLLGWSRLPSTQFTMTRDGSKFIFEGQGYGHGVGLCQWSALQMARNGMNYKDILAYFYTGTSIQIYEYR